MGRCEVCPDRPYVEDGKLADHARLLHPDLYGDGLDVWPDGAVVVVDETSPFEEERLG